MKPHKIGKCGKPLHEKSMKKLVKMDKNRSLRKQERNHGIQLNLEN